MFLNYREQEHSQPLAALSPSPRRLGRAGGRASGGICWEGMEEASHGGDGGWGVQKRWLCRPRKALLPQLWGVCGGTVGEGSWSRAGAAEGWG